MPMKKKRTWIILALIANVGLLPLVLAAPAGSTPQRSSGLLFHCCQETPDGRPYCCFKCCVFRYNCLDHEICERRAKKK